MRSKINPNAPAIETLYWWTKRDTRKSHYLVRCRKGVITSACGGIGKVDLKKWRVAGLADMAAACQGCRDKVAEKQGAGSKEQGAGSGEQGNAAKVIAGLVNVEKSNAAMRKQDPDGDCPKCKNALGTWICERCGADVRGKTTACEAVPKAKRWRTVFGQGGES